MASSVWVVRTIWPPRGPSRTTVVHVSIAAADLYAGCAEPVQPGAFESTRHYYPRVLNAQIHPLVGFFLRMKPERLVDRYCHLNPRVAPRDLNEILEYQPKHLRWAGTDLFHVTTERGVRRMVVIETNSCPSGNKSLPLLAEEFEQGGYRRLLERAFMPLLAKRGLPKGDLAVIYDKNYTETSGYAAAMADLSGERVWLAPMPAGQPDPPARFDDGLLEVRDESGQWHPIRAAMRYVTQRPWERIPVQTKTYIFNPIIACLAGGRNKLVAAKAYDLYNAELQACGLEIHTPETIRDVRREEIPLWVQRFGGHAVIKVPYANAGQGVYTITSSAELDVFMAADIAYDAFVVQALVGNYGWSSSGPSGRFYQVGTMPNRHGAIFVADIRMMISASPDGMRPVALYARRAPNPLTAALDGSDSWGMLGTNLSRKRADGGWEADDERLVLMDRKDFNSLGVGLDDLIEGFIQTVLATIAIDRLASNLLSQKGKLKRRLFRSLNDDQVLLDELVP